MLQRDRPIPLYYQLELHLREQIESGQWKPGDRLPTELDLARRHGVSRIVVQMALERLEDEGLIERHRGRGTFVHANAGSSRKIERDPGHHFGFEQDILRQGFRLRVRVLAIEEGPAEPHVAQLLGLPLGEPVVRLRRAGTADGTALWLESRFFPQNVGEAIRDGDLTLPAISQLIEERCDLRTAGARVRIEAAAATPNQAQHLEIGAGAPVLLNEFVYYGQDSRPIQAIRAFFRADRYAFTFEVAPPAQASTDGAWTIGVVRAERGLT